MRGKRPKQKLSKGTVSKARPEKSRYVIFDTEITGFGLRVYPSGQMSWIFEYKEGEGGRRASTKRFTLGKAAIPGSTADVMKPHEARQKAGELRAYVRLGQDPQEAKKRGREAIKVGELIDEYIDNHVSHKLTPNTAEQYRSILDRFVRPDLGARKAIDVTRSDIAALHRKMKPIPYQANKMLAVVAALYSWAAIETNHGIQPDQKPAMGIKRYEEAKRQRILQRNELVRLGEAILEAERDGLPYNIDPRKKTKHAPKGKITKISPHVAGALRLLIFTGARLREILHLEWSQVNPERGLLLLPRSKTGQKEILLNAPAIAVLNSLEKVRVGKYVIAGDSQDKPRSDLKRPWAMVVKRAGIEDIRIHDLRHNFAIFGAGSGLGLPVIGKLLGHSTPETTQRYAKVAKDPAQAANERIGADLAAAIKYSIAETDDNVVDLRTRKG